MRLVAAPDGAITRYDRAIWITLPFDLAWAFDDFRACLTLTDALAFTLTATEMLRFVLTVADTDACNA
jgi:hypothetical protein